MSSRTMCQALATLIFVATSGHAAFELTQAGPRALALGNASAPLGGGPWNCLENPAGMSQNTGAEAGFFYQPGLFGLSELCSFGGGVSAHIGGTGVGVSAVAFGFDLYRETTAALSAGREILSGLSLGLRCRAQRLTINGYGSATGWSLDLGVRIECSHEIVLAATFVNITSSTLGTTGEELPQELACGVAYSPVTPLHIWISASKEMLAPTAIRCGAEIDIADPLTVRIGITDKPSLVSFGCGIHVAGVTVDYGYSYHSILGATQEVGVTIATP